MDDSELRDTLEKLHQELEQTGELDDESRELLQHLMGDIRTILDREEPSSAENYESLGDQLTDAIERYETTHPDLTLAMGHALDILSGAGI
jgi:polyhydroxyalkanoate synthesis regulator phasin